MSSQNQKASNRSTTNNNSLSSIPLNTVNSNSNKKENKEYHSLNEKRQSLDTNSNKNKLPGLNGFITQVSQNNDIMTKLQSNVTQNNEKDESSQQNKTFKAHMKERRLSLSLSMNKDTDNKVVSNQAVNKDYGYYFNGVIKYFKSTDDSYFANLFRDHFRHTYVSLQFCKNLKPPTKKDLIIRKSN